MTLRLILMTERPNMRGKLARGSDSASDIADRCFRFWIQAFWLAMGGGKNEQWGGTDMSDVAVQTQQITDTEHPAHWPSYLGRALSKAWALVTPADPREQEPDGLEVLDMLGGWEGSDARRRSIS